MISRPPSIFETLQSVYLARAYYVVARLCIADLLHRRPMTIRELAVETGFHEGSLLRIMRALAAHNVFAERNGKYVMTPGAEPLRSDVPGSIRDWAIYVGSPPNWQALDQAMACVETGDSGFECAHGKSMYDYGNDHPEFGESFIQGMAGWTVWQSQEIVKAYPFGAIQSVVDIAGGQGHLLTSVLQVATSARGVLFDQSATVAAAAERVRESGAGDRCELVGGNILEEIPAGYQTYMIKHVLRDWDDDRASTILANIRAAMGADSTLLIIDGVLDPANGVDRIQKLLDLEQMFWLTGRIRTASQWDDLLKDAGFRIASTYSTRIADATILACSAE